MNKRLLLEGMRYSVHCFCEYSANAISSRHFLKRDVPSVVIMRTHQRHQRLQPMHPVWLQVDDDSRQRMAINCSTRSRGLASMRHVHIIEEDQQTRPFKENAPIRSSSALLPLGSGLIVKYTLHISLFFGLSAFQSLLAGDPGIPLLCKLLLLLLRCPLLDLCQEPRCRTVPRCTSTPQTTAHQPS